MSEYFCNLIIPGAAKSGTSSLHELLGRNPDICMSDRKEPHFFSRLDTHARGPEFHNSLFQGTGRERIFGESSTGYMIWPNAIERICNDLYEPKIIILLREPIERAFSHYRWRYRLGLEPRSFLRAMKEDGYNYDPMQPDRFGYKSYLQFSKYATYCPLWEKAFGAGNVLMIDSDHLKTDHIDVQRRCFEFLGVRDTPTENSITANKTADIVSRTALLGPLSRLIPLGLRETAPYQSLRNAAKRRLSATPPITMSQEEIEYAADALGDDVTYFHRKFA